MAITKSRVERTDAVRRECIGLVARGSDRGCECPPPVRPRAVVAGPGRGSITETADADPARPAPVRNPELGFWGLRVQANSVTGFTRGRHDRFARCLLPCPTSSAQPARAAVSGERLPTPSTLLHFVVNTSPSPLRTSLYGPGLMDWGQYVAYAADGAGRSLHWHDRESIVRRPGRPRASQEQDMCCQRLLRQHEDLQLGGAPALDPGRATRLQVRSHHPRYANVSPAGSSLRGQRRRLVARLAGCRVSTTARGGDEERRPEQPLRAPQTDACDPCSSRPSVCPTVILLTE